MIELFYGFRQAIGIDFIQKIPAMPKEHPETGKQDHDVSFHLHFGGYEIGFEMRGQKYDLFRHRARTDNHDPERDENEGKMIPKPAIKHRSLLTANKGH